jgi:hypothetical protein
MNDLRTVPVELLRQALEALGKWSTGLDMDGVELNDLIATLEAALAQQEQGPHGCHCDLEEGMEPDGCVLDEGRPEHCIYAGSLLREGKDKTACEYWKPIEVKR